MSAIPWNTKKRAKRRKGKSKTVNWSGKSVLVTGADGFIGSHLVEKLAQRGAKTRALVYYNAFGGRGWLDGLGCRDRVEVVAGDVGDRDSVGRAMQGAEVVFHLAALVGIPYSYQAPESYVRTNVQGTLHVLQAAHGLGLERVIHASTSEVYGTARYVPMDENHPLQAQSPYAATKIGADKLVEAFHRSFNLPAVIVRPFNTFGPRQSARAVVPAIITQCLAGSTLCLGNLHPTRDLNYVGDITEGFLMAAASDKAVGKTINLGSGSEISIGELARLIAKLMHKEMKVSLDAERLRPAESEVERLLADSALARDLLGWQPRVSLEEGLRISIDWFEKNLGTYRTGIYEI